MTHHPRHVAAAALAVRGGHAAARDARRTGGDATSRRESGTGEESGGHGSSSGKYGESLGRLRANRGGPGMRERETTSSSAQVDVTLP